MAIFTAISASSQIDQQPPTDTSSPITHQQQIATSVAITEKGGLTREEYQNPCGLTDKAEVADLCEQRRMAEAAERQVRWVEAQFWATLGEILLLVLAVSASGWAAWKAGASAKAAEKSIEVANRALVVSQRPWVSATIRIASSLVFKDGEGRITFRVVMKNFGQSPAINVEVECKIVPQSHMAWDEMVKITDEARKRKPRRMLGHKIFPNEEFIYDNSMPISRADIEAAAAKIGFPGMNERVFPAIVGCVVYNSTFSGDNYTTEFIAYFGRHDPAMPNAMFGIETQDGEIPISQLKLQLSFGSGQAD